MYTGLFEWLTQAPLSICFMMEMADARLDDLVLNPEIFKDVKVGDFIEISADKDAPGEKTMIFKVQNLQPAKGTP